MLAYGDTALKKEKGGAQLPIPPCNMTLQHFSLKWSLCSQPINQAGPVTCFDQQNVVEAMACRAGAWASRSAGSYLLPAPCYAAREQAHAPC